MLWCSNYGFRGSMGYSFSIILSVSHFKPGLRYVGDIAGFHLTKKLLEPYRPRYGKKFSVPTLYGNTTASGKKTMFLNRIGQSYFLALNNIS